MRVNAIATKRPPPADAIDPHFLCFSCSLICKRPHTHYPQWRVLNSGSPNRSLDPVVAPFYAPSSADQPASSPASGLRFSRDASTSAAVTQSDTASRHHSMFPLLRPLLVTFLALREFLVTEVFTAPRRGKSVEPHHHRVPPSFTCEVPARVLRA